MMKRKQKAVYAFQDGKKGNVAKTQETLKTRTMQYFVLLRTLFLFSEVPKHSHVNFSKVSSA